MIMKYQISIVCIAMACMALLSSCKKDETEGNGKPANISYIRTPYPEKADSAITKAEKLQTIVIVGSNLQAVNRVLFDEDVATLNPNYITGSAIILSVPFSEKHTTNLAVVTRDGYRTDYPFETVVPAPRLDGFKSEYVADGGEAVINGSFFYEPLKVWFRTEDGTDSVEADITTFDGNRIACTVPDGAVEGRITVSSKYGQTRSLFVFRDTRHRIASFNEGKVNDQMFGNPWGIGIIDSTDNPVDGGYMLFKRAEVGEWFWSQEDLAGCYWDAYHALRAPFLPAGTDITEWGLRFEANVITWTDLPMHIWFAGGKEQFDLGADGATDTPQAHWCPWLVGGDATSDEWTVAEFKTDGWETFTIPLTDFKYDKLGQFSTDGQTSLVMSDIATYEKLNFIIFGKQCDPTTKHDIHVCIDNPRLVKLYPTEEDFE